METVLSAIIIGLVAFSAVLSIGSSITIFVVGLFCSVILLFVLLKNRNNESLNNTDHCLLEAHDQSKAFLFPLFFFVIILGSSFFYWFAYYPGGFNLDAYGQWMQAHGDLPYNDWHPVISTLLIQLCLRIVDSFDFYICIQIILFAASLSGLFYTMQKNGIPRLVLLGISFYIGLVPSIGLNTICMTKDVQFTILLINLYHCYISVFFSGGQWLKKIHHLALMCILSVLAMTVRHNGILFVLPAFALLMICYRKQFIRIGIAALITVLCFYTIKGPVYRMLQVEPHSNVVGESVGIPMAILANALVFDPENIPEDVHQFLNEIASDEEWKEHYYTGEWDSCKWDFGGTELLQGESAFRILKYAGRTIVACPQASYESVRANTRIVWEPFVSNVDWIPEEYIAENDVGIIGHSVPILHSVAEVIKKISMLPILSVTIWNTGAQIDAVLLVYWLKDRCKDRKKLLFFVPLICYNLGTMLLLAGPNQRYFYCNAVLFLPIITLILCRNNHDLQRNDDEEEKKSKKLPL